MKGYMVGKGEDCVEGGDNLLQYCFVWYFFRLISHIGLFISVNCHSFVASVG
jgi:hypothetical protein